jgi:hypothetical protein
MTEKWQREGGAGTSLSFKREPPKARIDAKIKTMTKNQQKYRTSIFA